MLTAMTGSTLDVFETTLLVRGFYYEGWDPSGKPLKMRKQDPSTIRRVLA